MPGSHFHGSPHTPYLWFQYNFFAPILSILNYALPALTGLLLAVILTQISSFSLFGSLAPLREKKATHHCFPDQGVIPTPGASSAKGGGRLHLGSNQRVIRVIKFNKMPSHDEAREMPHSIIKGLFCDSMGSPHTQAQKNKR